MESKDPSALAAEIEGEQQKRGDLASQAVEWFLSDETVGELYLRDSVIDELSEHLGVSRGRANTSIADTVGDIVDPVQQMTKRGVKYVGAIEYRVFSDEGAYGYVDFDDRYGMRKRVVCARCVEKHKYDENVSHATQGDGSCPSDASWQQLLNRVTTHYADSHTTAPADIEPGASLIDGTTIAGNKTFHAGNDGPDSGLDADTLGGQKPSNIGGGAKSGTKEFLSQSNMAQVAASATEMQEAIEVGLMQNIAASQTAMQEVVSSQTAMQEVAASQTAMQKVAASQTAMNEVTVSATARGEIVSSSTAMNEMAASLTAMSDIASDTTFMNEVAASQTAMQEVVASQTAIQKVVTSQTAMQEVAASQTAMVEMAASQTVMQELAASQTAMTEIDQVDFAVSAIMCGTTTLDPTGFASADAITQASSAMAEISGSSTTMQTLAASQTAMNEVVSSQTAMNEVVSSQTAMQEVAASQTAMQEVAASQTAMQEVANTRVAIDEIGSETNENITENTVLNSSTAATELGNSSLVERFEERGGNARNFSANLTDTRVLIVSNNNSGNSANLEFTNDVGSEQAQSGKTLIVNSVNSNGNGPFNNTNANPGFDAITIS